MSNLFPQTIFLNNRHTRSVHKSFPNFTYSKNKWKCR